MATEPFLPPSNVLHVLKAKKPLAPTNIASAKANILKYNN